MYLAISFVQVYALFQDVKALTPIKLSRNQIECDNHTRFMHFNIYMLKWEHRNKTVCHMKKKPIKDQGIKELDNLVYFTLLLSFIRIETKSSIKLFSQQIILHASMVKLKGQIIIVINYQIITQLQRYYIFR